MRQSAREPQALVVAASAQSAGSEWDGNQACSRGRRRQQPHHHSRHIGRDARQALVLEGVHRRPGSRIEPHRRADGRERRRPLTAQAARPEVRFWLAAALAPGGAYRPPARAAYRADQIVGALVGQQPVADETLRRQQQPFEGVSHAARARRPRASLRVVRDALERTGPRRARPGGPACRVRHAR